MKTATVYHAYHLESLSKIAPYLRQVKEMGGDVFITTTPDRLDAVKSNLGEHTIFCYENSGYDIVPFLKCVRDIDTRRFSCVFKLHSKNENSRRSRLMLDIYLKALLGSDGRNAIELSFGSSRPPGIISALEFARSVNGLMYGNRAMFQDLCLLLGFNREVGTTDLFFAGSMFAVAGGPIYDFSTKLLNTSMASRSTFSGTGSDGDIAHTLERIIPFYCTHKSQSGLALLNPTWMTKNRQVIAYKSSLFRLQCHVNYFNIGSNDSSSKSADATPELLEKIASVVDIESYDSHYRVSEAFPGISPLSHYYWFADYEYYDAPGETGFSSCQYRLARRDVYRNGSSACIHWLTRGQQERPGLFLSANENNEGSPVPVLKAGYWENVHQRIQLVESGQRHNIASALMLINDRISLSLEHEDLDAAYTAAYEGCIEHALTPGYVEIIAIFHMYKQEWGSAQYHWQIYEHVKRHPRIHSLGTGRLYSHDKSYDPVLVYQDQLHLSQVTNYNSESGCELSLEGTCVYTTLFGDYDTIKPLKFEKGSVAFIMFTDKYRADASLAGWHQVVCTSHSYGSSNLDAKYYKILPHRILSDYKYSLFVDANTEFLTNPAPLLLHLASACKFAMFAHPFRRSLIGEACAIIGYGKYQCEPIIDQLSAYIENGYDNSISCMLEGSFMWREHGDSGVSSFMEEWWNHICKYTSRDQISLSYLCQKRNFYPALVNPSIGTSRENKFFKKNLHKHEK